MRPICLALSALCLFAALRLCHLASVTWLDMPCVYAGLVFAFAAGVLAAIGARAIATPRAPVGSYIAIMMFLVMAMPARADVPDGGAAPAAVVVSPAPASHPPVAVTVASAAAATPVALHGSDPIVGAPDVAQAALALQVPADPARAAAVLHAADSALHQLQQMLGIPMPQALPPAFYATNFGKAVIWTSFGLGVASSVVAPIIVAFAPRAP